MTKGVGITRMQRIKGQLLNTETPEATEAREATDRINGEPLRLARIGWIPLLTWLSEKPRRKDVKS